MTDLKNFLIGFIVRWLLKIGGGFFLSLGVSENSLTVTVSAIVSIILGLVISLLQHTKAINTPVEKKA